MAATEKKQKRYSRKNKNQHVWNFSRVGGVNRVNLESGEDLIALEHLDQKLWTALSCPVSGLEIDSKTLELIDSDNDGRIRIPEILAAVKWVTSSLKNADDLIKGSNVLPLSAIDDTTDEGKQLIASARQILINLGKSDITELAVEDTSNTTAIFADTHFNGDGVITEDAAGKNENLKKLINDIIVCIGSSDDLSGKAGINIEHIDAFYQQCEDYSAWYAKAEADKDEILPYGEETAAAFDAFNLVKAKIDDYFLRCRLAKFDADSTNILNALDGRYEEIKTKDLSDCVDEIATFPIAKVEAGKALPLSENINPAWEEALNRFYELVIKPVMPKEKALTEIAWKKIVARFNVYNTWLSEKAGVAVESLGLSAVRELLNGKSREKLTSFIEQDKAHEADTQNIMKVDKLVRYYRDLHKLLNNYVTFYDFYYPNSEAIFQAGYLFFDQRCCNLCIKVNDMPKHNLLAGASGICLIYCDCTSKKLGEHMTIVAALTDGDFDNIEVGRNAIFYDRQGNDWDAVIVKVIENPISIRQAFWTPYRRTAKFISEQIEKFASDKDKGVEAATTTDVEIKTDDAGTPPAPPFDIAKFVGIFAALSLALGAIGSVIMSMLTGFLSLSWWKMPIAVFAIILCISGPSMILAWLKLRKRNLALVLDANGWAINARATINIVFGRTLTHLAELPKNSRVNLTDPFAKKKSKFLPIFIAILIALVAAAFLWWRFVDVNIFLQAKEFILGIF